MTKEELGDMLHRTTELQNGGKITVNTAWSLSFIQHIPKLIEDVESGSDFSNAGVAISAGAEIYNKKVEKLHTSVLMCLLRSKDDADGPERANPGMWPCARAHLDTHHDVTGCIASGERTHTPAGCRYMTCIKASCTWVHADEPAAPGAKKRAGKKVADDPSQTMCARADLEMDPADLSMSIAVDPLFHHESESLQESKIANLQLYTLDAFSGCDVQPTSDTMPSALYTQPEAKPVSPGLDLAWTQPHWLELAEFAAAQTTVMPSLEAHLPTSVCAEAVDVLILRGIQERAGLMRDAAGARIHADLWCTRA